MRSSQIAIACSMHLMYVFRELSYPFFLNSAGRVVWVLGRSSNQYWDGKRRVKCTLVSDGRNQQQ